MKKGKKSKSKVKDFIKKNVGGVKAATLQMFFIIAIIVIIIGFIILGVSKVLVKDSRAQNIPIVAEASFSNLGETIQYNGSIILNDGDIYSWTFEGTMNEYDAYLATKEKLVDYVKKNGKKESKKVSSEDLILITKYGKQIKETIQIGCSNETEETGTTSYYVKSNDGMMTLSSSGQCAGMNEDKNAKEALKIIKKYISQ